MTEVPKRRRRSGPVKLAARRDDERAALRALRDRLADLIDDPDTSARDISPLSRRFQEVQDRLRGLDQLAADEERRAALADDGTELFDPENL